MEELVRVRASGDTGPAPAPPPKKPTPTATATSSRREREYKRDREGQFASVDTGGSKTRIPSVSGGSSRRRSGGGGGGRSGGASSAGKRKTSRTPPKNDPDRVRFLQRLLKSLRIANLAEDGVYGEATERAVMALQRKLGMTETGRVSNGLLKRIRDAEILSPCAKGAKRSREMDEMDELIRAVGLVDECDCDGDCDCDDYDGEPTHRSQLLRCCPNEHTFAREWSLDGIDIIRGGRGGDGRTVEAYATVFDTPAEIKDQHGHYMETIHRAAFDEVLRDGFSKVKVFFNHGMNIHGTPSDAWSVPIGVPLDVRPDGKGLRTITRYNEGDDGDRVLEAIRNGAITGYSFRGPIRQSNPPRIPRARDGQPLPTVTRMRLGLTEYGPTPMPYYAGAGILALRSRLRQLQDLDDSAWDRLVDILTASTPRDQEAVRTTVSATPTEGPGAEDQPVEALRSAEDIRRKIARAKILLGVK